jgi:hypothetical protein
MIQTVDWAIIKNIFWLFSVCFYLYQQHSGLCKVKKALNQVVQLDLKFVQ